MFILSLFSNRWIALKMICAVALIYGLGEHSWRTLGWEYSRYQYCSVDPERFHDAKVLCGPGQVLHVSETEIVMSEFGHPVRVMYPPNLKIQTVSVGDILTIDGVYHHHGYVVATDVRRHHYYITKKYIIYAVSVCVMCVVVVFFLFHFRIRLHGWRPEFTLVKRRGRDG